MRTVRNDSANVARWVADLIPDVRAQGFGNCKAIGVIGNNGEPLGGAVFHDYQPGYRTMSVSVAAISAHWITRRIIADILSYPFGELGLFKVWSAIAIGNLRSQRFCSGIGFTKEGTLRHQFGHKNHAVMYGMTAPEFKAKYHKELTNGQTVRSHAA